MYNSILQFQTNIGYVKNLSTIYSSLKGLTTSIDLSDILRSELLMSVSALDHFVRNSIEEGMLEIYQGIRISTMAFNDFSVKMKNHQYAIVHPAQTNWLRVEIQEKVGRNSYQKSNNIEKGLHAVYDGDLWEEVGKKISQKPDILTRKLNLIVRRRDLIVHQVDNDPSNPGQRHDITEKEVTEAVDHIEKVTEAIFQVIK